jgi:hypothetical protein
MSPAETKDFILGGRAQFAVDNGTGRRFVYRATRKENAGKVVYFLSVDSKLKGGRDGAYMGLIDPDSGHVRLTGKSRFIANDPAYKAAEWALQRTWNGKGLPLPSSLTHVGRCGRCGRLLTHPDSIQSGLGPECRKMSV